MTELTTGIDLVHRQIRIAAGEPLGLRQEELWHSGATPSNAAFTPRTRRTISSLHRARSWPYKEPTGPGVRVDGGVYAGWSVPLDYDPILAKLIVWAETRELACVRMANALRDYVILGIDTSVPFLRDVISHPRFRDGDTTTGFVKKYFDGWKEEKPGPEVLALAMAAAALDGLDPSRGGYSEAQRKAEVPASPWHTLGNWRIGG